MDPEHLSFHFTQMEHELFAAMESDARSQLENDAKIRAVAQRVSTYDEFREMVRGAHLKAVNRALTTNKNPRPRIWNNISSRNQEGTLAGETFCNCPISVSSQHHFPTSSSQFLCLWRRSEQEARLSLLFKLGPAGLGHLFRIDIPAELLGEIFQTLLSFDAEDVPAVVALLEALTEIKRFSLGLQFLNSEERATCRQLIRKLRDSLVLREQDLAELGVTEWSLQQLAEKYQIRLLPD